ncbi:MAG: formylmethanofuran dehydrogenase subunit E family protein [Candidatus Omnitrophota bacterium]
MANRKMQEKINLKEAVKFHGHLGPYLVLGMLAGNLALRKAGANKHFGLKVLVYGADKRPKSCLIDGLQLSTGATYGKGNIQKRPGKDIKIIIKNLKSGKEVVITLNEQLRVKLSALKGHSESERFAKWLLRSDFRKILELK